MSIRYWIAQHISDLFRKEPLNIGVFVEKNDTVAARFVGEVNGNQIDGRKLRSFDHPGVYRQWVQYWRETIAESSPNYLIEMSGAHYRVIEGGEVDGADDDDTEDVLNYLFALLVSEGGFSEAMRVTKEPTDEEEEEEEGSLTKEIADTFSEFQLLADVSSLYIPHPIRRNVVLRGVKVQQHQADFVQRNGRLYVMQAIDFTLRQKRWSRSRAGESAYVFRDLKSSAEDTQAISIVRVTDEDQRSEHVQYGLSLLEAESDEIVHWLEENERDRFLQDRRVVAELE